MSDKKLTTVELLYKYLEEGNIETVMQAKDMFLKLEKTSLEISYEEGKLSELYKSAILKKVLN